MSDNNSFQPQKSKPLNFTGFQEKSDDAPQRRASGNMPELHYSHRADSERTKLLSRAFIKDPSNTGNGNCNKSSSETGGTQSFNGKST